MYKICLRNYYTRKCKYKCIFNVVFNLNAKKNKTRQPKMD